jgi:hypothetical protein
MAINEGTNEGTKVPSSSLLAYKNIFNYIFGTAFSKKLY